MSDTHRMNTRSGNANARPGLAQVILNRQVADDKKHRLRSPESNAEEKWSIAAKKIAAMEFAIMEEDAVDDTPRAPPSKAKKKRPCQARSESVIADSTAVSPLTPGSDSESKGEESEEERLKVKGRKPKKNLSDRWSRRLSLMRVTTAKPAYVPESFPSTFSSSAWHVIDSFSSLTMSMNVCP